MYPLPLVQRMAAGSVRALDGSMPVIPLSVRLASSAEVDKKFSPRSFEPREAFDDPEWIGELADGLPFMQGARQVSLCPAQPHKCARSPSLQNLDQVVRTAVSKVLTAFLTTGSFLAQLQRADPAALPSHRCSEVLCLMSWDYGGLHVYSKQNRSDGPLGGLRCLHPPKSFRTGLAI